MPIIESEYEEVSATEMTRAERVSKLEHRGLAMEEAALSDDAEQQR